MMNFDTRSVDDYHKMSERIGMDTESDFDVSTFSDVHVGVRDMMLNEGLSTSESRLLTPQLDEQLNLMKEITGEYPGGYLKAVSLHGFSRDYKERMLTENNDLLLSLQKANPDAGFKTLDEILTETRAETRVARERATRAMMQAEGVSNLGMITGTMRAIFEDPLIIGSMVASAVFTKGAGATAISRAIGTAKTEAAIGVISEAMIQPSVYSWKKRIDSPYSIQEAATNILIAGGFAGVLGAGGSLVYSAATFRKAARLKREAFKDGDTGAKYEAEILEQHADELDTKPTDIELKDHFDAIDKVATDLEEGQIPDVSQITGKKTAMDKTLADFEGIVAEMKKENVDYKAKKKMLDEMELVDPTSGRAMADVALQKVQQGEEVIEPVKAPTKPDDIIPEELQTELKGLDDQLEPVREADIDIPTEQIVDEEGVIQVKTRKANELLDEIDADQNSLDELATCYKGDIDG